MSSDRPGAKFGATERARQRSSVDPRWRAWESGHESGARSVTSTRLPGTADVKSRLFPKTRSWFALGAPLELMSPLSIMRMVFALEAIIWLSVGLVWDRLGLFVPLAAGTCALAMWIALLQVNAIGERASLALSALAIGNSAVLLWSEGGSVSPFSYVAVGVPLGVVAALFLRGRLVAILEAAAAGVVFAALVTSAGTGVALAAALLWLFGAGTAATAVHFLVRTVQRDGRTDADTGLPNGFGLAQLVSKRGEWTRFLVASMSLDGIGDARVALGYRVGTELIRRAVEDIGQVLPADALIGRVIADELVVIRRLTPAADAHEDDVEGAIPEHVAEEAQAVATRLIEAVSFGRYLADGVEISLRAHIGLAIAPWDGREVEELVRRASLSAPLAASNGLALARGREDAGTMTATDLALLADLRLADERGELSLAYQPQISLRRDEAVSVEALLRWSSPSRGAVPPDRFIVLAERTGLIDRLTDWALREALDAQVRWRASGIELPVSVNVSARSLTQPDLASWILHELVARDLPSRALSIEITETAAPEDLARAVELLRPLYEEGVRISIDDFGVGYTSLAVLPHLALNEVKVDKGFVLRSLTSSIDAAIVRTVCELAGRLGLDVVAEGVETEEIARFVRETGYDLVQGFHFSRPLTEANLLAYLRAVNHRQALGA